MEKRRICIHEWEVIKEGWATQNGEKSYSIYIDFFDKYFSLVDDTMTSEKFYDEMYDKYDGDSEEAYDFYEDNSVYIRTRIDDDEHRELKLIVTYQGETHYFHLVRVSEFSIYEVNNLLL